MNFLLRRIGRGILAMLPERNELLYRLARRYIDRYDGNNQLDMRTNGELLFMKQRLPHAHTVFDVGAARGEWAAYALAINPSIDLHCFEPGPATFEKLAARGLRAHLNPFGIGDTSSEAILYSSQSTPELDSLYDRRGAGIGDRSRESITIRTLDDYCTERGVGFIDFLKIDVEGHEAAVLRGMRGLMGARAVKVIQFEYGGTNIDAHVLLKDIWEDLSSYGYRFSKLFPDGPRPYERYSQSLEDFQYQNWAAVLEEE